MEDPLRDPLDFRHRGGGNGKGHAANSSVNGGPQLLGKRVLNGTPVTRVTTVVLGALAASALVWYVVQYVSFISRLPGGSGETDSVAPGEFESQCDVLKGVPLRAAIS